MNTALLRIHMLNTDSRIYRERQRMPFIRTFLAALLLSLACLTPMWW